MKVFKIILLFLSSFLLYTNVYAESNLVIESVKTTEKSSTMVVEDLSYVDTTITSKMEFHNLNDFVTYEIEVKNNSEKTYTLSKIIDHLNTDYLRVESDDIGMSISKDEKKNIHVKVKYVEELINVESFVPNDSSLTLNFIDTTVSANPMTFDHFALLLIQIMMTVGIIVFSIIYFKEPKKLLLLLLFIPIYVFAQEMVNVNFNFSRVSVHGRFLSYHIQLDDGSGNVNDYTKTYGDTVGDLPVPEKVGYTFEGWVDQNDRVVNSDTIVHEDLDLTASFGLVHYTITYYLNGGELALPNPTTYTVEDEFTLYNPSLVGYTFLGWGEGDSGILQTQKTIYPGTTGNKIFRAFYSPNPNTDYMVIHKQMNLEGVYEETERETLHGATDSTISPQPKEYPGFKTPELQTITILGDGSSSVTYLYERNKYTFQVNNRGMIESGTVDGTYYYGTRINVVAKIKDGYSLRWNDGSEVYNRSFLLEDNTILTPSYTPNDNTPYKVIHKQMNLDGSSYIVYDEDTFYGTTDTTVTPLPNEYEGFTSPDAEEITITGDGKASVTYLYTRNKYRLTINDSDYVDTTTPSGEYYYGTSITLTAKNIEYDFLGWSNEETTRTITFILSEDITIYPLYHFIVFNYPFIEGEDVFEAPHTGYYRLETWGAQGGILNSSHYGGYGGYSTGIVYLEEGDTLYVNVGGTGTSTIDSHYSAYNGGGYGGSYYGYATAGGATHIAKVSGELKNLESYKGTLSQDGTYYISDDIIIVSGAGAGVATWGCSTSYGGHGGGYMGTPYDWGGTQIRGGKTNGQHGGGFGYGGYQSNNAHSTPGGGSGFFGGGTDSNICVAGGGSGYIANPSLTNKHMSCYNCNIHTGTEILTVPTACHSKDPIENCSKEEDGFARITYVGDFSMSEHTIDMYLSLKVGNTINILGGATIDNSMTFESSDSSIATINSSGNVSAVAIGDVDITFTYLDIEIIYHITIST